MPNGWRASVDIAPDWSADFAAAAPGQLQGQPGDEQVHDPVGDQPDPGEVLEGVAVPGAPSGAHGRIRPLHVQSLALLRRVPPKQFSLAQWRGRTPGEHVGRVRDTGPVASEGTGMLTAGGLDDTSPDVARRTWPRWVLLGLAMIAVAVAAVVTESLGARLLVGSLGLFLALRGAFLLRGARTEAVTGDLARRARGLGSQATVLGMAGLAVALASTSLSGRVLLVVVPVSLFAGAAALLPRGGVARRGGQALLVWSVLVTGLLIVTGVAQSWGRAADVATVVGALGLAVLAVPVLLGAVRLRQIGRQPVSVMPAACAGCACGAGGCGALPR